MDDYEFDWGDPADDQLPGQQDGPRFDVYDFTFNMSYLAIFDQVCDGLKTATSIKIFNCTFASLNERQCEQLCDAIKQNTSVERIYISRSDRITNQLLQCVFARLPKSIKYVTLHVLDDVASTKTLKNLIDNAQICPAKNFVLFLDACDGLEKRRFYEKNIELLKKTNINHINWYWPDLFDSPVQPDVRGFTEFCQFLSKNDKLKSFVSSTEIGPVVAVPLAQYINSSKALTTLDIILTKETVKPEDLPPLVELCKAITHSNIKTLKITAGMDLIVAISDIVRHSKKLKKFEFVNLQAPTAAYVMLNEALKYSESIRTCFISTGTKDDTEVIVLTTQIKVLKEYLLRNRKLQNTRVLDTITLLFNIARDNTPSLTTIPRDIWPIIMSLVEIPGVSLDFGVIAHAIFKDKSIRRVVYKKSNV